jgi:VWFA-related protein
MKLRRALIFCAAYAFAQDRPFRTETRVVQVPVAVTDAAGKNVEGLKAGDFVVLDDGAPQTIELDTFGTGAAPISLVIAIQASDISSPAMVKIRRIGGMIHPLVIGHRGEAAVVTFDNQITWRQDFTSDPDEIQAAVNRLKPGSQMQARLFDAVIEAALRMKDRKGRKVVLLISETRDRGSEARIESAVEAVEREGVQVFAAPYSAFSSAWLAKPEDLPPPSAPNYLAVFREMFRLARTSDTQALTQATGGSEYPFLRERAIEKAVEKLGVDVHSQYILSFPPVAGRKGMHRIEVSTPRRADLHLRSRQAYWAD